MPDFEVDRNVYNFRFMDLDNSGSIDYWEFIKHESLSYLNRRTKVREKNNKRLSTL